MKVPPTSLLLVPSTVLLCYLLPFGGSVLRPFFVHTFQIKSDADLQAIMPAATRFAADHSAWFAVAVSIIGTLGFALSLLVPSTSVRFAVAALCVQGFILWAACFCVFYSAFTRFSIYRGDVFEWDYLFTAGAGVFPITFVAILLPLVFVVLPSRSVAGA